MHRSFSMISLLALSLILVLSAPIANADDGEWEKVSDDEGVDVYAMDIPGSDLIAFRGIKTMNFPIDRVAYVLLNEDVEAKKQWIDRIMDFQILEFSDNHGVFYSSYGLPWPMSDRDFVIESQFILDHVGHRFILDIKSIDHKKAPETIGVRGRVMSSKYVLTALNKTTTLVEVEIHSDPMGLLPDWLINNIQKPWPHNTLLKMERQVGKKHNKPHPKVTPLLKSAPEMLSEQQTP
jgi:hypothetical protein